jgi:energy-coupling factor transport system permease protein
MTIALRFIPTLLRELDQLVKAQRARGADFRVRDPRRLGQALLPLTVPLFVLSFRHADDLALAMTSRCYRGGTARTRYRELRFTWRDALAAVLVVGWLGGALVLGRLGGWPA